DPSLQGDNDQIFFGATVTYANQSGEETTVTIVGMDEVDLDSNHVSWISPIAKALIKAREGDTVPLRTPAGIEQIDILEVKYPSGKATAA
ncbi:MAG: GreA/GreB family elongation factor, partial [Cupriavidus sp.]|nr:GreA/GreB family elongation factor [Cupriavidus sp.]